MNMIYIGEVVFYLLAFILALKLLCRDRSQIFRDFTNEFLNTQKFR